MRGAILAIGFLAATTFASAQQSKAPPSGKAATISIERYEGGRVITDLGYNISLNKNSSLKREWFVVRDENSPASIEGSAGVRVAYKSEERHSSGQYEYRMTYQLKAKEPIAAFEIRVHMLDVFGRLLQTLSSTELVDFSDSPSFDGTWRIWSENEASEAFASVAYVAQVRTASGRVYEADRAAVFDQIRKVARRIAEADLEPKREVPTKQ